jgi:drug/metabolite transporter (DMT)-like permease
MTALPLARPGTSIAFWAGLFVFFWASGFLSAKFGFPYAEPLTFLFWRYSLAVFCLVPIALLSGAAWPRSPRQAFHIMVAGLGIQTGYLIGVYCGIYNGISTGVIALIVGLQPLLTGALAGTILGERVSPRQWLGLVLGFAGLGLVVAEKVALGSATAAGLGFGLLGLVSITMGTLYQKRFCTDMQMWSGISIQAVVSAAVTGLLATASETMHIAWTGEFVFALLWSTLGLSVVTAALYFYLVRRGAAAKVTSLIYLSPPTTAVMGYLVFDERLGAVAIAGMAAAMLGVALANR